MVVELMLIALILVLCIIADKFSGKFGMPALILFIGIGMLFGSDGIVKIPFDNFAVTEQICTIALGFIMFYGGFNTKWKAAKPETNCQGLFNQIHKKATKKVPEADFSS